MSDDDGVTANEEDGPARPVYDIDFRIAEQREQQGAEFGVQLGAVPDYAMPDVLIRALKGLLALFDPSAHVVGTAQAVMAPADDVAKSVTGDGHDEISAALDLFEALRDQGEKYVTLTAQQVREVHDVLDQAHTLSHVVSAKVQKANPEVRVLLGGEPAPVYAVATVSADPDRPAGSLLVTLDPPLESRQLRPASVVARQDSLLDAALAALDALTERSTGPLGRLGTVSIRCQICGHVQHGHSARVDATVWMAEHLRERCWERNGPVAGTGTYVLAEQVRPGDEVRIEFAREDGSWPYEGDEDYEVTTGIVADRGGDYGLAVDDGTWTRLKTPANARMRKVFLVKRGEWSGALAALATLRRERNEEEAVVRDSVARLARDSGVTLSGQAQSAVEKLAGMGMTWRAKALHRRNILNKLGRLFELPELVEADSMAPETQLEQALLGLVNNARSPFHQELRAELDAPDSPSVIRGTPIEQAAGTLLGMVKTARGAALAPPPVLSDPGQAAARVSAMATALGLHAREMGRGVQISATPFTEETAGD